MTPLFILINFISTFCVLKKKSKIFSCIYHSLVLAFVPGCQIEYSDIHISTAVIPVKLLEKIKIDSELLKMSYLCLLSLSLKEGWQEKGWDRNTSKRLEYPFAQMSGKLVSS